MQKNAKPQKQETKESEVLSSQSFKNACKKASQGIKLRTACLTSDADWETIRDAVNANKNGTATAEQNNIARWVDRALAMADESLTLTWLEGGDKGRATESFLKATKREYNVNVQMIVESELRTLIAYAKTIICEDCFNKLAEAMSSENARDLAEMSDSLK